MNIYCFYVYIVIDLKGHKHSHVRLFCITEPILFLPSQFGIFSSQRIVSAEKAKKTFPHFTTVHRAHNQNTQPSAICKSDRERKSYDSLILQSIVKILGNWCLRSWL